MLDLSDIPYSEILPAGTLCRGRIEFLTNSEPSALPDNYTSLSDYIFVNEWAGEFRCHYMVTHPFSTVIRHNIPLWDVKTGEKIFRGHVFLKRLLRAFHLEVSDFTPAYIDKQEVEIYAGIRKGSDGQQYNYLKSFITDKD